MLTSIDEKILESFTVLSKYKFERFCDILDYLHQNELVSGVLLGGSVSYKKDIKKSDIDLFCLISQVKSFETELKNVLPTLNDLDAIIYQGSYPWTEKLYTIFYKSDLDFCIDLSLVNINNSETFFWEPNGHILFDNNL